MTAPTEDAPTEIVAATTDPTPVVFTPELIHDILHRARSESVMDMGGKHGLPAGRDIYRYLARDPEFGAEFRRVNMKYKRVARETVAGFRNVLSSTDVSRISIALRKVCTLKENIFARIHFENLGWLSDEEMNVLTSAMLKLHRPRDESITPVADLEQRMNDEREKYQAFLRGENIQTGAPSPRKIGNDRS